LNPNLLNLQAEGHLMVKANTEDGVHSQKRTLGLTQAASTSTAQEAIQLVATVAKAQVDITKVVTATVEALTIIMEAPPTTMEAHKVATTPTKNRKALHLSEIILKMLFHHLHTANSSPQGVQLNLMTATSRDHQRLTKKTELKSSNDSFI
jgi:hypothetical protein